MWDKGHDDWPTQEEQAVTNQQGGRKFPQTINHTGGRKTLICVFMHNFGYT